MLRRHRCINEYFSGVSLALSVTAPALRRARCQNGLDRNEPTSESSTGTRIRLGLEAGAAAI